MFKGVSKTNSGELLIINSNLWDLQNEINSVKDKAQLLDMSLIYNYKVSKDDIANNDVMFVHHFADSGHVSKSAIIQVKEKIEKILGNEKTDFDTFDNQSKAGFIKQLVQSLPHINRHLKDIGLNEIELSKEMFSKTNAENVLVNRNMNGLILNVNEKIANRMSFEYVAHVIHEDKMDSNKNGVNWQEEYVLKNIDSAVNMPIKYEPDYDGVPIGHGYFTEDIDGNLVSYWSEIAGMVTAVRIDYIPDTGKRGLICSAYIDTIMHSDLAKWIKGRFLDGKPIDTSVEICGKKDSDNNQLPIVYEGVNKTPKVPVDFDYIGSSILGVEPADDYARFIDINSKGELVTINKKEEEKRLKLEEQVEKLTEDLRLQSIELDESKNANSLLNANIEELNVNITELNSSATKSAEELETLRTFKEEKEKEIIVNTFKNSLNDYDKSVVEVFKAEIEAFEADPLNYDLSSLKMSILEKELVFTKEEKEKIIKNSKEKEDEFTFVDENNEDEKTYNFEE